MRYSLKLRLGKKKIDILTSASVCPYICDTHKVRSTETWAGAFIWFVLLAVQYAYLLIAVNISDSVLERWFMNTNLEAAKCPSLLCRCPLEVLPHCNGT